MGKLYKSRKLIIITSWTLVILNLGLIFYFSSKSADQSKELSGNVTKIVAQSVQKVSPSKEATIDIEILHYLLRKNAHFFSYLVLGVLVMNAMKRSGVDGFKGIIVTFLICVLYAISDEFHQTFVLGRSGEVRDVIIDSAGVTIGILKYLGLVRIIKRLFNKQQVIHKI
jgi:VanZ family protein